MSAFILNDSGSSVLYTFSSMVAEMEREAKNTGNTGSEPARRLALLRALYLLSATRTTFNEESFAFTTATDQSEYNLATPGFPVDAVEFDLIEVAINATGGLYQEVRPASLREVREILEGGTASPSSSPEFYTWHHRKLIFAPRSHAALTVRGEYHADARRDATTGELLTVNSTTQTNGWFSEGFNLLFAKAMEIYHASFARDEKAAAFYRIQVKDAEKALHSEWIRKAGRGLQVAGYL